MRLLRGAWFGFLFGLSVVLVAGCGQRPPESGIYTLRAELEPPDFRRHGSGAGEVRVFTEPVTVEFENVEISTEEG